MMPSKELEAVMSRCADLLEANLPEGQRINWHDRGKYSTELRATLPDFYLNTAAERDRFDAVIDQVNASEYRTASELDRSPYGDHLRIVFADSNGG